VLTDVPTLRGEHAGKGKPVRRRKISGVVHDDILRVLEESNEQERYAMEGGWQSYAKTRSEGRWPQATCRERRGRTISASVQRLRKNVNVQVRKSP